MLLAFTSSVTTAGESFAVYSVIIVLEPERSCLSVIVALDPELSCLGYWETTTGWSFEVYYMIIGLEPERSCLSVIVALEPELSLLGSRDLELIFPRWFGKPYLGFLWRGLKGIVCDGGDGRKYFGIGVTLG